MDVDSILNFIRADLRVNEDYQDYDKYADPFLSGQISKKNIESILNFFLLFSEEIQIKVTNQLFIMASFYDESVENVHIYNLFFLSLIEAFVNENYFANLDISQQMMDLLDSIFNSNFNSTEFQQRILDTFSAYISANNELKTSDFYEYILNLIDYFSSTLNLLPLFISLVSHPPLPPQELINKIVNVIYENSYEKKYTSDTFHFFGFCVKNSLDVDYEPFFKQIQYFISNGNKEIYSSFIDFLIAFPEAKPDILDPLLQLEESTKSNKMKTKIFLIFCKQNYLEIWKESNADEIIKCASKNMKTENPYLRTLAIIVYIYYQKISDIQYSNEIAQIMVDNFENPLLTIPILTLIRQWILDDTMDNDIKGQVYDMVINEYENLKTVINSNVDESVSQDYLIFESLIDTINSFE